MRLFWIFNPKTIGHSSRHEESVFLLYYERNINIMVKTLKLAIALINEDKITHKNLNKELFDMQYLTAKACNRVMTYLYADTQQTFIMKEQGLAIPSANDMYGKSRMSYLTNKIGEIMTTSHSRIANQTRTFVEKQFAKDVKKGLLKGNVSLTNFRRDCAIHLHNNSYKLIETDKGQGVIISLFNKSKTREFGWKTGQIEFFFPRISKAEKTILQHIRSGKYKQTAATLTYNKHKKKWMISIPYSFTPEESTGQNTLTVRLGSDVLLNLSVKNEGTQEIKKMKRYDAIVPGLEELQAMRSKMYALRKSYGNATRIASANNCGKGYKKRAEKLLQLRDKEARFRDTFNHKISRYIIDIAKKYDCGLIVLEDFSKTENAAFGDWVYYDLASKIGYKAEEVGISVMEMNTDGVDTSSDTSDTTEPTENE